MKFSFHISVCLSTSKDTNSKKGPSITDQPLPNIFNRNGPVNIHVPQPEENSDDEVLFFFKFTVCRLCSFVFFIRKEICECNVRDSLRKVFEYQKKTFKETFKLEYGLVICQYLCLLVEVIFLLIMFAKSMESYKEYSNRDSYTVQQNANSSDFFIVKNGYSSENCSINQNSEFWHYWINPISNFSNSSVTDFYQYYIKRSPENVLIHIGFWLTTFIAFFDIFYSVYEKLKEPEEKKPLPPSKSQCCAWCCCCCRQKCSICKAKTKNCRNECWKRYKVWLFQMLLIVPESLLSGFDYDSECLQARTRFYELIMTAVSPLTFYLPFIVMLLYFDDKFPKLLKLLQKKCSSTSPNNANKTISCFNYAALVVWIICSSLFVVYLTLLAVCCFFASFFDGDSQTVAIYAIGESVSKIIYKILGCIRKCGMYDSYISNHFNFLFLFNILVKNGKCCCKKVEQNGVV